MNKNAVVSQIPSHAAAGRMRAASAGYNFARRQDRFEDQLEHDFEHGFDGHSSDYEHHHGPGCGCPSCVRVGYGGYGHHGYGGYFDPRRSCGSVPPYDCGDCVRGCTSGCDWGNTCAFPQPPPRRCYCFPASFSSTCGQTHHRLLEAYGNSRPC